jgi:hypothetical protein
MKNCSLIRYIGKILVQNQEMEQQLLAAFVSQQCLSSSRTEHRNVIHGTIHAKLQCTEMLAAKTSQSSPMVTGLDVTQAISTIITTLYNTEQ